MINCLFWWVHCDFIQDGGCHSLRVKSTGTPFGAVVACLARKLFGFVLTKVHVLDQVGVSVASFVGWEHVTAKANVAL